MEIQEIKVALPSYGVRLKEAIIPFTKGMFYLLFDDEKQQRLELIKMNELFNAIADDLSIDYENIWGKYVNSLKRIRRELDLDALAFERNDPAAKSLEEVYLAYPGFYAVAVYRLARELRKLKVPIVPRMMSEYAHGITGADIHPGAEIGASFFIDHATGIVIGETAVVKDNVKIYQGVTLGGLQISKKMAYIKRHPTVENNVTIYANATILGGSIVIGENSTIGANVWIKKSVPKNSMVTYQTDNIVKQPKRIGRHITDQIGNTPLIEVSNLLSNKKVKLLLKLEGNNPGGSVKDRAAFNMIREALRRGDINKGDTIIEATSGNTGIALAFIAPLLAVKAVLVMPENSTIERVQTMEAYGAQVLLTDSVNGIEGSRDYAEKLSKENGYFMLNQFQNDDNWKAHYKSTGPEIWKDSGGKITHFVSAMGTTGTIMGVSTFLKEKNENVQIIGVQPEDDSRIPGIRKWPEEYLPKIFDGSKVDRVLEVSSEQAGNTARELAEKEGVFGGMSSGGTIASALKLAKEIDEGVIVAIVPDRGDRYLSSSLFS